ncbi:NAD-glutamate dehydrogenase, partial [candidate division KSB1 bacterium]|nr:NAD-glutamate dehydrogenase [candidate division KSB1 bacterium]
MKGLMTKDKLSKNSFKEFCEKYSFYIPEYQKNFYSPENLQLFLEARYDFFRVHSKELQIKVYNPGSKYTWLANSSVIEILMPDSPFIVDTVVDICNSQHFHINLLIHPILSVQRLEDGTLAQVDYPVNTDENESYVYVEINRLQKKELAQLQKDISNNLQELRKVVTDYPKMVSLMDSLCLEHETENEEIAWLKENFVMLGLSHYKSHQLRPKHFGIFKKAKVREVVSQELNSRPLFSAKESVAYRESNLRSNVNKERKMYFAVVRNAGADVVLAGHFRHRAELSLRNDIPAIKRLLEEMASKFRVTSTSYLQKELYRIAQSLPVGLWLTRPPAFLLRWFMKIIYNMYSTEISYDLALDENYNIVWTEIILPAADTGKIPNQRLHDFNQKHGIEIAYNIRYPINQIEVVFLGFRSDGQTLEQLKQLLQSNAHDLFSTWSSVFRELVLKKYSANGYETLNRYLGGMSPEYEVHQESKEALRDLEILENLNETGYCVAYYQQLKDDEDLIKIYISGPAKLGRLVPIINNFGFSINRDNRFIYRHDGVEKFTYSFGVQRDENLEPEDRTRIADCIEAVLNEDLTSKPINELVRIAGLTKRELDLAKALCAYFYKFNNAYTFFSIQKVLVRYPRFAKCLVRFFEVKFNPESEPADIKKAKTAISDSFRELNSVLDETICKTFFNIVNAIVRTNYYLNKREISFKIKSSLIENMPAPVPLYEIYVYSHDLEGIHLRGGRIARGGIRWSDRPDDFRTEILSLMKAQMIKNTLIVPVGSKGGFVIKNNNASNHEERMAAGVNAYKRFISALLDLTDNISKDGSIVPAEGIKRFDGDDPYLVVAADKGTATFSDIANEISNERKFWLTDAFASGGSNGYDHKKQGITARGAWESVKRHFHEIGVNPEKSQIKVVGIGDMAGDVFGNGMLLSRSMKLVAAFNHLYIFLDPNPDPEASFQERKRLFKKCANWNEYKKELISKGGGIFNRSSRRVELSHEIRTKLGIKPKNLSGEDLIKAILRAPVDLLWNGGIGTYVKATSETNFQAGDPANDRVRVNASELRVKVVGEGGNLGFTQAARVEAAEGGVLLNTDAIDNSGGVNMSDHEVNLKILLDILLRKRSINGSFARNAIIKKYEKEEIDLVLRQNYLNNLGLSLDMRRQPAQFVFIRALIKFLNRQGLFDRAKDCIPFEADLDKLEHESRALPRPVLCALIGFTKLVGSQMFLESGGFDDPWYDRIILRYFPAELSNKYSRHIKKHPLKREIIATEIINEIVNHAGLVFCQRMIMATGRSLTEIADTYMRLSEFLKLDEMRSLIETAGEWLHPNLHYEYLIFLEEKVYQIAKKLLLNPEHLKLLDEKDSLTFKKMLNEAAIRSRFRLSRKLRLTLRILSDEDAHGVNNAFKRVDTLEDTFNIFLNN